MGTDKEVDLERISRRILTAGAIALVLSTSAIAWHDDEKTGDSQRTIANTETASVTTGTYFEKVNQNSHRFRLVSPYEIAPPAIANAILGTEVINGTGEAVGEVEAILVDAETGQVGLVLAAVNAAEDPAEHLLAPIREMALLGDYLVWLSHGDDDFRNDMHI